MAELLNRFLLLDVMESSAEEIPVSETSETSESNKGIIIKHILARFTYLRTIFTVNIAASDDGSIIANIYDGYCLKWDERVFCISNWKYRDLGEPTGPTTDAVWEPSKPWIAEFDPLDQFMLKTCYMLKVSKDDECELISWEAINLISTRFIMEGISEISREYFADDKKIAELVAELFSKGISLSKVD